MPLHLRNSSERVPFSFCLPTLSVSWQPSYNGAFVSSDACCTYGPSRHSTSGCQEKQTPVPRPFLGPGQSVVICGIWSLCIFWTTASLFNLRVSPSFIPGHCAEFHDILGEVMLLHIKASVPQISLRWLSNILSNFYCFENQGSLCPS